MAIPYTRQFKPGDRGADVEAVGRALARSKTPGNTSLLRFAAYPRPVRRIWGTRKQHDLRRFKKRQGLKVDGAYTKAAHEKLEPFFDAKARKLMASYEPPAQDVHWTKLLASMRALDAHTRGYRLGAGHGVKLSSLSPGDSYDCSSSTAKVLYDAGLFPEEYAWVSGKFARSYGQPGKGKLFTVYANDGHVWLRLHRSRWWRFDTSPHSSSDTRSGPRLRYTPRFTFGFSARHWSGT